MKINIGKLKEGMVVRNYKELTSLLGVSYNRNHKDKVLSAIDGYVVYKQVGNAYHIEKVRGVDIKSDAAEVLIKHPVSDILFVDSIKRNRVVTEVTTAEEMEAKFPYTEWNFDTENDTFL